MTDEVHDPQRRRSQPPGWRSPPADTEPRRPQCLHCQYDLTGFAVGQECPECGMQIQQLEHHQARPWTTRVALAIGLCSTGSMAIGLILKRMASTTHTMATGDGLICLTVPLSILGLIAFGAAWWEVRHNPHLYTRRSMRQAKIGLVLCLTPVIVAVLAFTVPMLWALL